MNIVLSDKYGHKRQVDDKSLFAVSCNGTDHVSAR